MKHKYAFSLESTAKNFAEDLKKDDKLNNISVAQEGDQYTVSFEFKTKFDSKAQCMSEKDEGKYKDKEYASRDEINEALGNIHNYIMEELDYRMKWANARISELESMFYQHKKGHLPPINDAGKLEKALEILDLKDSYDIVKPVVWAKASRRNKTEILVK